MHQSIIVWVAMMERYQDTLIAFHHSTLCYYAQHYAELQDRFVDDME